MLRSRCRNSTHQNYSNKCPILSFLPAVISVIEWFSVHSAVSLQCSYHSSHLHVSMLNKTVSVHWNPLEFVQMLTFLTRFLFYALTKTLSSLIVKGETEEGLKDKTTACQGLWLLLSCAPSVEESDIIDLEKRYWLLKAQSRTGRFDLETFVPLVSPPIHASLSEGNTGFSHVSASAIFSCFYPSCSVLTLRVHYLFLQACFMPLMRIGTITSTLKRSPVDSLPAVGAPSLKDRSVRWNERMQMNKP